MTADKKSVLNDPRVTNNADGTVSVTLSRPVSLTTDGEVLTSIQLGPLNGQAMVDTLPDTTTGLECPMRRLAPAQTTLVFKYADEVA